MFASSKTRIFPGSRRKEERYRVSPSFIPIFTSRKYRKSIISGDELRYNGTCAVNSKPNLIFSSFKYVRNSKLDLIDEEEIVQIFVDVLRRFCEQKQDSAKKKKREKTQSSR